MASRALIRTDAIGMVFNRLAAVRARPSLWIGQAGVDSLTIYGFFKDFSIEVDAATSKLSLSVEGLSKAAPIKPLSVDVAWPNVGDPDGTKPADNATNSADPNSPFGPDRTVAQVRQSIDEFEAVAGPGGQIDQAFDGISADLAGARSDIAAALLALANTQGAVTSLETLVNIRPNLISNGSAERQLDGLEFTGCTVVPVTDNSFGPHFAITPQSGASLIAVYLPTFSAGPNRTYTVAADSQIRLSGGTASCYTRIIFLDANGALIGSTPDNQPFVNGAHDFDITPAGRAKHAYQATSPAGTVRARVVFVVAGFTPGSLTDCRLRQVKAELGVLPPTSYSYGGNAATDALVRQVDASRANDFAANASRFVNVEARVTTVEADVTSASANYTTLANTVAIANASQATFNSTLTARFRQGSPNLLPNPSGEDDLNGWIPVGEGWAVIRGYWTGPFFQNAGGAEGTYMIRDVDVEAGLGYSLSAGMAPDAPLAGQVYYLWLDAGYNQIGGPISELRGYGWVREASGVAVAPPGAVRARIVMRRAFAGPNIRFRELQFQEGPATDYRNDATLAYSFGRINDLSVITANANAVLASRTSTVEAQLAGTANSGLKQSIATVDQKAQAGVDAQSAVAQLSQSVTAQFQGVGAALATKADASITQAALADFAGKLAAYIRLRALAGTNSAEIDVVATEAYSRIIFRAAQFLFEGDAIFDGSVFIKKLFRDDMSQIGRDADGAFRVFGLGNAGLHPSFLIELPNCDCNQKSVVELVVHQSNTSAFPTGGVPAYDGGVKVRVVYPNGQYEEKDLGNFVERFMKFTIPAGQGIGTVRVQAAVYNGNTNFTEGSGTQADPYILHKSVDNSITYIDVEATWRFIG
jgi:hypothetical protein